MDLMSGYKNRVQGVVGLVIGNENSASSEDSYVERLLDRISNGVLAGDGRTAIAELQFVVAESCAAQLAFGAVGFPVLLSVLKEEHDDVEMVCGALETLMSALTLIDQAKALKNEVQPTLMNTDLLSREAESNSLLLSLLSEEDFYTCYYTLQLVDNCAVKKYIAAFLLRLQEAILTIPRGITRLMDMLMDREEIQKILVFEGAFEKIFSIIKEEGCSEGGVVVQQSRCNSSSRCLLFKIALCELRCLYMDCLELLNNLIRNNASNQVLLRETMGFDPLISILKLRGSSYSFTQQKTINFLSALETIGLLIMRGPEIDTGKDVNRLTNKAVLGLVLDHLLMLGVESQWAPVPVRCTALRCIGDLIASHTKNLDALASKEPQVEPALNSILRIILRTSSMQEFVAADYVFKCFCEKNPDGQAMLASTLIPQSQPMTHALPEEDANMSFGRSDKYLAKFSLNAVILSNGRATKIIQKGHLFLGRGTICLLAHSSRECFEVQTWSRAASVLSHVLKDNMQCKERVLRIELEEPTPSLGAPEPLLHRVVKYLALASCMKSKEGKPNASRNTYVQAIILKPLVIWHSDCPSVVQCFLDLHPHLTYLLELVSNSTTIGCIRGLAAIILGEYVIYNKFSGSGNDAFTIVDAISQKVGLTSYFLKFEEMQKSIIFSFAKPAEPRKPLTRSIASSMAEIEDVEENEASDLKNEDHLMLASMNLEADIRESIVDIYSHPESKVAAVSVELQQKGWESDGDYVKRLKSFVEKIFLVAMRPWLKTWPRLVGVPEHRSSGGSERVLLEALHRDLQEASQRLDTLKTEKTKIESEASMYCNLAGKMESNLKNLSDAYNSLEQANFHLEKEMKGLKSGGATPIPDVKAVKAEAREEAQKESDAELNDLFVCLGQEQSKVEKLSVRLLELGEDVDNLLEGIGDDIGLLEEAEVEED
ncbi:hypothetical protein HYC85_013296 [Camellia sinensis]|uniref:Golgin candidate 6 n=1 Tax=Camellia sinensis TaxID=4442 RepID=A0A7J7H307_CAMSI|nr:hypothetical protein HYC85_013296 [Camellia sinensis]